MQNLKPTFAYACFRMELEKEARNRANRGLSSEYINQSNNFRIASDDNDVDLREIEFKKLSSIDDKMQVSYDYDSLDLDELDESKSKPFETTRFLHA